MRDFIYQLGTSEDDWINPARSKALLAYRENSIWMKD